METTILANEQRYEQKFEGPLTADDRQLLENIGCAWPEPDDEAAWLERMNCLAEIGNTDLRSLGNESSRDDVLAARDEFYGKFTRLDWSQRKFKPNEQYPIPTHFIGLQRVLAANGIDQVRYFQTSAVNGCMPGTALQEKLDALAAYGFDVSRMLSSGDRLAWLNLSYGSIIERIQPFYAAARLVSGGSANYRQNALDFVAKLPSALNHRPGKVRTLTRIGSAIAANTCSLDTGLTVVRSLMIQNLEKVVAAYLTNASTARSLRTIISHAGQNYPDYDKDELRAMIAQYPGDPVAKEYLRTYPLNDLDVDAVYARHVRARDRWQRQREITRDWQGPLLLGDPALSASRALLSVIDYPKLSGEDLAYLASQLDGGADEAKVRRALAARMLPLVVEIVESASNVDNLPEALGDACLALSEVACNYQPGEPQWAAGFELTAVREIMNALAGNSGARYQGMTAAQVEALYGEYVPKEFHAAGVGPDEDSVDSGAATKAENTAQPHLTELQRQLLAWKQK